MKMRTDHRLLLVTLITLITLSPFTHAQSVGRIYIGYAPGGVVDSVSRIVADALRDDNQQQYVIENRAGGQGKIALDAVKAATPDGKSLLLTPIANICIFPHTQKNLGYDPLRDLTPVAMTGAYSQALAVGSATPARTLGEFVQWAKANPKKASFGTPGFGNIPHFFGLLFARTANIELTNVPYKGTTPAISDLLGGQLPAVISGLGDFLPHARSDKLRILALASADRSSLATSVPTFKELGYADIDGSGWYGLFAPPNTPASVVDGINRAVNRALDNPSVQKRMQMLSLDIRVATPTQFGEIIREDYARWGRVIRAAGFTAVD
jgi:tripartite-type tricarboxylate transporter receptor subunit TctC